MRFLRITIAGLMAAVFFAAVDCLLLRNAEVLAGGLLIAFALQLGFFLSIRRRGPSRRFWIGFEAIGAIELIAFLACILAGPWDMIRWPGFVSHHLPIHDISLVLPQDAALWYLRHVYFDIDGPLRVIDVVTIFEVSYGLPMLLLATVGGIAVALIVPRCRPSSTRSPRDSECSSPAGHATV